MARVGDMTVRLAGETATVTGRWWAIGQNGAEYFDYAARFLSVWVQTDRGLAQHRLQFSRNQQRIEG